MNRIDLREALFPIPLLSSSISNQIDRWNTEIAVLTDRLDELTHIDVRPLIEPEIRRREQLFVSRHRVGERAETLPIIAAIRSVLHDLEVGYL